jgi:hypothetical protein
VNGDQSNFAIVTDHAIANVWLKNCEWMHLSGSQAFPFDSQLPIDDVYYAILSTPNCFDTVTHYSWRDLSQVISNMGDY